MLTQDLNTYANWFDTHPIAFGLLIVWSLLWKGFALWRSASLRQKYWFTIILLINTAGILEIIYLFFIARKYEVEVIER